MRRRRHWPTTTSGPVPENVEVKALGTEALLKAHLPQWLALLKIGDHDQAPRRSCRHEETRQPQRRCAIAAKELEWVGNIERFVLGRGGVEAPIRIYADEERIKALLKHWDDDTIGHQRALARVETYVPEFKDPYAEALSHLRKLQSDASVYLAATDRLKSAIVTELNRDNPQALEPC